MKTKSFLLKSLLLFTALLFVTESYSQKKLKPVAFYLKNLPAERIGEYSDKKIKEMLELDNFLVIEVDCSSFPKTSPELEDALVIYHQNSPNILSAYEDDNTAIDYSTMFYVPEGYIVTRNIPVWNIKEHGAEGSLQRVLNTFNTVIAPKRGLDTVESPDDLVEPDGSPVNWNLHIDIVHPSGTASKAVPILLNFSSNSPRQSPHQPSKDAGTVYRSIFPFGFLTTGYAWATADHCYNPLARGESYGYIDQFSLDDWNGLASTTAYVRYLKGHAEQYNLNKKIGVMGISKASYSAVRISDTKNAETSEYFTFNSTPNTKPQPWSGIDSSVDVVYAAAGNGTRRVPKYVNENTAPMITSAGSKDEYNQWPIYPEVVKHFKNEDLIHLPLWMEELGHTYPGVGTDLTTGENRYVIFKRFFDHYLMPNAETEKDVFYILPKENSPEVDTKGYSRILAPDGVLPSVMLGLSAYAPITVRFLSDFTLSEIEQNVKVLNKSTNEEITGVWSASMKNTTFTFESASELIKNETYKIVVSSNLKGSTLKSDDVIREFTISKEIEEEDENNITKLFPADDTYTAIAKNTTSRGSEDKIRVRYSTMGDWRFEGYLKFDISSLKKNDIKSAKIKLAPSTSVSAPMTISFYKTTTEWNESTLVSANRPTVESAYFDQQRLTSIDSWVEAEAGAILKDALDKNEQYLSIAIRIPSSEGSENVYFNSKEAVNPNLHPYLSVYKIESDVGLSKEYELPINILIKNKHIYYNGINTLKANIFDMSGKNVLTKDVKSGETISLLTLNQGIYIAKLHENETEMSIKIIL